MKNKCAVRANIRNQENTVVESELFKDSLSITGDRKMAKKLYALGHNEEFLEQVKEDAKFDHNGEITFSSLIDVAKINIEEEKILEHLNKSLDIKVTNYKEAVLQVVFFNNNSSFKDKYMAIMSETKKGYELKIVPKNIENELILYNEIFNRSLQDKLIYRLAELGVNVEFLENADFDGRYSTKNAKQTALGLLSLISLLTNENGTINENILAEESGHFIVGALGNHALIERLLSLITEDVLRSILKEDYDNRDMGDSAKREVAGTLVGMSLVKNHYNNKFKYLIDKIINTSKKIFAKLTKDLITLDILEAQEIADKIAESFFSEAFEGTVENALLIKETLYHKETTEQKALNNIMLRLKKLSFELKGLESEALDEIYIDIFKMDYFRVLAQDTTALKKSIIDEAFATLLVQLHSFMDSKFLLGLSHIDVTEQADFFGKLRNKSNYLRAVKLICDTIDKTVEIIEETSTTKKVFISTLNGVKEIDIPVYIKEIKNFLSSIERVVTGKELTLFVNFLSKIHGSKFINRAARVVLKIPETKSDTQTDDNNKGFLGLLKSILPRAIKIGETQESLLQKVKWLEHDVNLFERFVFSASNSSDTVLLLADKSVKHFRKEAQLLTIKDIDAVLDFEERFKELKKQGLIKSMEDFYEIDPDTGLYTSYFIDKYHWGVINKEFKEWYENEKKRFIAENPEITQYDDVTQGVVLEQYLTPLVEKWYKNHYDYVQDPKNPHNTIRVPKSNYINHDYKLLSNEAKQLLNDIKRFKQSKDSLIGLGSNAEHRAPLFTAKFTNVISNKRKVNSLATSIGQAMIFKLHETFVTDSVSRDYGSDMTYNSPSEMVFQNIIQYEKDAVNRIPLYGIMPVKDPTTMSTDVFGTLLAYSNMANQYNSASKVVDVLEVGKTVLKRRRIQGILEEQEDISKVSNAYNSYVKYVDKTMYKIFDTKKSLKINILLRNIVRLINRMASMIYMGGNLHGGTIGTMTGFIELFKEAIAGEFFNTKEFAIAIKEYYKYAIPSLLQSTKNIKTNKLDLFILEFDALFKNSTLFEHYDSTKSSIVNAFEGVFWFAYKTGEHFMQTIPFIAMAGKTKLYIVNSEGLLEHKSIWDFYTQNNYNLEYIMKNSYKKLDYIETDKDLRDLLLIITNAAYQKVSFNLLNVPAKLLPYLNRYNTQDLESIRELIIEDRQNLHFTLKDATEFQERCREICNRLHGVYNFIDKTEFQGIILGEMLLAMRGYAIGMMERRFMGDKYNVLLKGEGSGTITDLVTVLFSTFESYGSFGLTTRALLFPILGGKKTELRMLNAGFSSHLYRNMRRNQMDFIIIGILALLSLLTEADDSPDSEDRLLGILYYAFNRLRREQMAFNSIRGVREEASSLLGFNPIGISALADTYYILSRYAMQHTVTPVNRRIKPENLPKNYTKYYYNKKSINYTYGDSKAELKFKKLCPFWKSVLVAKDPYGSAAAFSYAKDRF